MRAKSLPSPAATSLTVADVAAETATSVGTVLQWIASRQLVAINVSRSVRAKKPRWRIRRSDLDAFLAARTHTAPPPRAPRRSRVPDDVLRFY
jgi:excisionase family DNA binding protein